MSKKLDLNLLQALDALMRERNVTRAATRLQTSQPALSAQLVRLRTMFDDPLLVAGSRGMTPTARALEIAPRLADLIQEFHALVEPDLFDPSTAQAVIQISSPDSMLNMPAAYIEGWARTAPGIKLAFLPLNRLSKPEIDNRMATGQLDIIMSLSSEIPERLHVRHVVNESFVLAMRADHPFDKPVMSVDDICNFKHLVVSPMGGAFVGALDVVLEELGRRREVVGSMPSFMLAKQILQNSDFAAVLPRPLGLSFKGALKLYELPVRVPNGEVVLGWHERTHHSPPHRWLRERLFEMFKESPLTDNPVTAAPGALILQGKQP